MPPPRAMIESTLRLSYMGIDLHPAYILTDYKSAKVQACFWLKFQGGDFMSLTGTKEYALVPVKDDDFVRDMVAYAADRFSPEEIQACSSSRRSCALPAHARYLDVELYSCWRLGYDARVPFTKRRICTGREKISHQQKCQGH